MVCARPRLSAALIAALAIGIAGGRTAPAHAEPAPDAARVERAQAAFTAAQEAYRAGELKQALEQFLSAYALVPSAELEFDLGRIYERLGEADPAIKYFRAYIRRGQLATEERTEIETRIANLIDLRTRQRAQVIEAPPARAALTAEARAFFERGAKLFRRGRFEAALAAFSAAGDFAALPELSYNLALTCERLQRWDDAIAYYRAYLREAKASPDAGAIEARIKTIAAAARTRAGAATTGRSPRRPAR